MSQQPALCAICQIRPASRLMKMKLGTRITGYYVVATTYRTSYAQFPVCEDDFQTISKLSRRKSLGTAGFFFGTIIAVFVCIALYPGANTSVLGAIVLGVLMLGFAALVIVSSVIGLRASREFNKYKAIVQKQLAAQAQKAPAPAR